MENETLDHVSAFELLCEEGLIDCQTLAEFVGFWDHGWHNLALEDISRARQSMTEEEFPIADQINQTNAVSVLNDYCRTAL